MAIFVAIYLGFVWLMALWVPGLRNTRFLGFLGIASAIFLGVGVVSQSVGDPVRIAIVALVSLAILLPERIGLGSMTRQEREVVDRIDRASKLVELGDRESTRSAIREISALLDSDVVLDVSLRGPMRMLRRGWSRRVEVTSAPSTSPTPARSFEVAARNYLADVRFRRVLGYRSHIRPVDEDVALRAYLDDFRVQMPESAYRDDMADPHASLSAASNVLEELQGLPIRDPEAATLRDELAALLQQELLLAGTSSGVAERAAYEAASDHIAVTWRRLEQRFRPIGPS